MLVPPESFDEEGRVSAHKASQSGYPASPHGFMSPSCVCILRCGGGAFRAGGGLMNKPFRGFRSILNPTANTKNDLLLYYLLRSYHTIINHTHKINPIRQPTQIKHFGVTGGKVGFFFAVKSLPYGIGNGKGGYPQTPEGGFKGNV